MNLTRVSEEAYFTTDPFVFANPALIERLKSEVNSTSRKRIRVCLHRDTNERLHEFFIVYTDKTAIQPHKHLGKDESMQLLEGEADVVFYNDRGDVQKILHLSPSGNFYIRVPADTWHTFVMKSEHVVLFVATPGPYIREHTVWADWKMGS